MKIIGKRKIGCVRSTRFQTGATLIELMIGLALSLIVTSSMVVLMGSTMGSATRIIEMSQLTDELRNTMSMLTRDVRRANYNPYSLYCYSNSDCGVDDTTTRTNFIGDLNLVAGGTCLVYSLERVIEDDGLPGDIGGGGFRLATTGGVGRIEMWTGDLAPPADCSGNSWVAVTDPEFVNITNFIADDAEGPDGTFEGTINRQDGTLMLTQRVRQIRVTLEGQLLLDGTITRRVEDVIKVRNDFIESA